MLSKFFIDRPIFATVLSVVITLAGFIALVRGLRAMGCPAMVLLGGTTEASLAAEIRRHAGEIGITEANTANTPPGEIGVSAPSPRAAACQSAS